MNEEDIAKKWEKFKKGCDNSTFFWEQEGLNQKDRLWYHVEHTLGLPHQEMGGLGQMK